MALPRLCTHFGTCGGCLFQDISYDEQLKKKEEAVRSYFAPLGTEDKVAPILGASQIERYRNKMEFSFSESASKRHFLGLMKRKQRRVVDLEECLLSPPWFTEILSPVRKWWLERGLSAYYPPLDRGSLRTLILREAWRTKERMAVLTVSGHPDYLLHQKDKDMLQELLSPFLESGTLVLRTQHTSKGSPTFFREEILIGKGTISEIVQLEEGDSYTFTLRPSSFFQPNPAQAERLYSKAMALAKIASSEIVYDLYCGTAPLAIFASRYAKKVIGIELNPDAIADGVYNLASNGIVNVSLIAGDAPALAMAYAKSNPPDLIIVDPPRAGLSQAGCQAISSLMPKKFLYISCNPASQAKDLTDLVKIGYHIENLQPIDQFPHTPHIENIAFLYLP